MVMMQNGASRFHVVINHYRPTGSPAHLAAAALFSASLSANAPEVGAVEVVDGSPDPDPDLAASLEKVGAGYHHAGRRLSFSQGYNAGLARSTRPWTVLCASDVFPSQTIFATLCRTIDSVEDAETRLGCLIPLLTSADLRLQRLSRVPRHGVDVPLMTLNFNAFPTAYLAQVGGVPEEFGGCYNDVLLGRRMESDGRVIRLVPDRCLHYGSLTLSTGASDVSYLRDQRSLRERHPGLWRQDSLWNLRLEALSREPVVRALGKAAPLIPSRIRERAIDRLLGAWVSARGRFPPRR